MVVCSDTNLEKVSSIENRALISRLENILMRKVDLVQWMKEHLKSICGYIPKLHMMVNGSIVFHFLTDEVIDIIIGKNWVFGLCGSLVLDICYVNVIHKTIANYLLFGICIFF